MFKNTYYENMLTGEKKAVHLYQYEFSFPSRPNQLYYAVVYYNHQFNFRFERYFTSVKERLQWMLDNNCNFIKLFNIRSATL